MAKEFKDWLDEFVEQGANPKNVPDWPEEASGILTLEITSEDITIEDDKIVFNSDVAQEIMSMNKRLRVDASIVDPTLEQGKFIAVFTPRGITDYSLLQPNTIVYEYSTTNYLLDTYRTTYVEFVWNETTEKLYVDKNAPTHYEDHIVGFNTSFNDGNIRLTENVDMQVSSLNVLHINDYNIISTNTPSPSLEFNANSNNELESVVFREDGSSVDFTYTIPKGAKHYVVNELPTTNIDTTGNYYVMTESEDARGYLSTDIHNLTTTEYPPSTTGTLRQDATVNSSDWVKLNATTISSGDYMGDIAIKFNIPCEVALSVNPRQTRLAFMYIDVNGVNVKLVNAGETYTYTRVFGVDETLCVRGASFSTNQFYYKLAIQPYTIDGKIPLSTNVDEYINFENIWFKNGGSGGSLVVANPTLAGTETDLTGLEVDGAKFKVPGQEQADWNQADADAKDYIKNKPNLAKVATSGNYNDLSNKPTMPTVTNLYSVKLVAWSGSDCVELYANYIPFLGDSTYSDAFDCLYDAINDAKEELHVYDERSGLLLIAYFRNGGATYGPSLYMGSDNSCSIGALDDGQLEFVKISGTQGPALLSIFSDSEATDGYKYNPEDGYSYVHKKE